MCGRFALSPITNKIEHLLPEVRIDQAIAPRYNISPGQEVACILNQSEKKVELLKWGLIPFWAKDPSIGNKMINARAETLAEKASFKTPFRRKRCIILASGFYEWKKIPGTKLKQPFYISLKDKSVFAFAGLWDSWKQSDSNFLKSCTIITTSPNELMSEIHDRMPVILAPDSIPKWLHVEEQETQSLQILLEPFDSNLMEAYEVGKYVNIPGYDSSDCIKPINQN